MDKTVHARFNRIVLISVLTSLLSLDSAAWPTIAKPAATAPNVLLIMTDDVGFGSSSTFGGAIPTPTFDALAEDGIRFSSFHTTAVCSPTRASLLTGRTPHRVNVGNTTNWPTNYPGYTSDIPNSAATVAQLLQANGFSTAMFGKSHITPEWEMSTSGPFTRWPSGLGFDYFYGFLGADMSAFEPLLVEQNRWHIPEAKAANYHLESDLADHAVQWINEQDAIAPDKPLFIYYATGAAHAPNHAPTAWLKRFRGKFDQGWDWLQEQTWRNQIDLGVIPESAGRSPRPDGLPAWSSLSTDQQKLYSRFMEAYAASLSYADAQIGRVIQALRQSGRLENTLVIYIQGDNGASAEGRADGRLFEQTGINGFDEGLPYLLSQIDAIGGVESYPLNTGGWAWAMNSPFPQSKRIASHLGGTRNGMVIRWPGHTQYSDRARFQFHHVSDIMPTILEAVGVAPPTEFQGVTQLPLDGESMLYTLTAPSAPPMRKEQIFEMFQNMGLYSDGWLLSSTPTWSPWLPANPTPPAEQRSWQLYDLTQDFSQINDVASQHPEKLTTLRQRFFTLASEGNILPIHDGQTGRDGMPSLNTDRNHFVYRNPIQQLTEQVAPPLIGRGFQITADVELSSDDTNGVIIAHGGRYGGYALYLSGGVPVFHYNAVPPVRQRVVAEGALPAGTHRITVAFQPDSNRRGAGGELSLLLDGKLAARQQLERTLRTWVSHTEGFDIGADLVTPVSDEYTSATSLFEGNILRVEVVPD